VLLVEDDPRVAMLIGELVRAEWAEGLVIAHALSVSDAAAELAANGATCVLLGPPAGRDALAAVEQLRSAAPDVPIVVIAEEAPDELGLTLVRAGAQDFLRRSELTPKLLSRAMRYAIERNRSEVELAHQALHDSLTSLPNRALFIDRLTVALDRSRRTGTPVAVMFLDVDNFKRINDSMGHAAGDLLLTLLADRFREMLRPMDTVSRFGGDEFTFLFEELDSEREATLIAERINHSASRSLTLADAPTSVTVSIGIAFVTDPAVDPESVIRDADAAMYRAKELGGARFQVHGDSPRGRSGADSELAEALRAALSGAQLRVHYQPSVSLNGETGLAGFEALVRWEHPERGLIDADEFVPVAEDTGLIIPIGEWVLDQALRDIERWHHERPDVSVSVNLSSRQLEHPGLVDNLAAAVRSSGADPSQLVLEVTEDTVEHNPDLAARMLDAVSRLGVRVAIDDFGTGHSSLSSLRDLPLDSIKIDRSFVSGLGTDPDGAAIVGALVELGHALGLTVVAEGVETDSQLARLRDLGCDGAQGYLFSKPLPEDGVEALLAPG
jgi:diguanylate cyclase (GGDEF)-like protein